MNKKALIWIVILFLVGDGNATVKLYTLCTNRLRCYFLALCFLSPGSTLGCVLSVSPCFPYDATFGSCVLGSGCLQPPLACWPLHSGGGGADWKTSKPLTITRSASWVSVLWWNILSRGGFRPPFLRDLMGSLWVQCWQDVPMVMGVIHTFEQVSSTN